MADPDFSFITPDVKLDEVPPLDYKRVIAFVNHFIMRSVHMLNVFADNAEKKIFDIETRIGRLSIELQLLESKLDSIPGIIEIRSDACGGSVQQPLDVKETSKTDETLLPAESASSGKLVQDDSSSAADSSQVAEGIKVEKKEQIKYRDDPRYAKYFKMLRLGVVEAAVRQKMTADGIDPDILHKPEEISEQQATEPQQHDSNDESSNSDALSSDCD